MTIPHCDLERLRLGWTDRQTKWKCGTTNEGIKVQYASPVSVLLDNNNQFALMCSLERGLVKRDIEISSALSCFFRSEKGHHLERFKENMLVLNRLDMEAD